MIFQLSKKEEALALNKEGKDQAQDLEISMMEANLNFHFYQ